jgi:uncharacterized protein DUF3352
MRRRLATLTVLSCAGALVAGCGGGGDSGGPLESSLAYLPDGSPFVVAFETDLEGDQYGSLQEILNRFPGGLNLEQLLAGELEGGDEGVDFEQDVKPLLGNPFVVGARDVASFLGDSGENEFVAALEVEDSDALDGLIEKTKAEEQGEVAGATLYEDDGTFFAVEEANVVFADSRQLLEDAVERADGDDHFDPTTFDDSLEGLPQEAVARIYFDVQALVAQDPDTEAARKVEWVGALRTFGMTAAVADESVDVEFNLKADGEGLSEEDLPLAAGEEAPAIVQRGGEIGFGVRDPSQIVTFFQAALQAVEPQDFADYETAKRAISQRLGVDVDEDLFGQLTGDTSVSVAVDGSFGARAEVEDAQAFGRTVDRIAASLPELGSGLGVTETRRAGALYEVRLADGGRFFFGVRNDVFVVASRAARALDLASEQPRPVDGADGSLVMAADAERVALQVLDLLGPQLGIGGLFGGGLFARPLDDLSGSVSSSTDGMRGRFSLTLD